MAVNTIRKHLYQALQQVREYVKARVIFFLIFSATFFSLMLLL